MLLEDVRALYLGTQRQRTLYRGDGLLWLGEDWADGIDPDVWFTYRAAAPDIAISGGRLVAKATLSYSGAEGQSNLAPLDGHLFDFEVIQTATQFATVETYWGVFRRGSPGGESIGFSRDGSGLRCVSYTNSGGNITRGSIAATFDPVAHRWCRVAEDASEVRWYTSPDRVSWTQRASWVPTFDLAALWSPYVGTGYWDAAQVGANNPGSAIFGDVRIGVM